MTISTFNPFLIGCIGAIAPEIIRIYKLRFNPNVRWSWSYLIFSFPFILLGGFMAHILEPTTSYAAFYTGVSTPFIITTLAKDSERDAQVLKHLTQEKEYLEFQLDHLKQNQYHSLDNTIIASSMASTLANQPGSGHTNTYHSNDDNGTTQHSALRGSKNTETPQNSSSLKYLENQHFHVTHAKLTHPTKHTSLQFFLKAL